MVGEDGVHLTEKANNFAAVNLCHRLAVGGDGPAGGERGWWQRKQCRWCCKQEAAEEISILNVDKSKAERKVRKNLIMVL